VPLEAGIKTIAEGGARGNIGRLPPVHIEVRNLTMAYGDFVVLRDLNFTVRHGDVFIIMGGSGCGKSTLMHHMIALKEPATGEVLYDGRSITRAPADERETMRRRFGVTYQSGALWSSMTLAENVGLPLVEFTGFEPRRDSPDCIAQTRTGWAQGF
jgi:phospholipid/cholesterol/gamma-HCH transport system ATP-binding protein